MGAVMDARAVALLSRSHGVAARVWASVNGSGFTQELPLQPGGQVQVSGSSAVRRTLTCTVAAPVDDPAVSTDTAELRAEYHVIDPSTGAAYGTRVGTFVVTAAKEVRPGLVQVTAEDRWRRVMDARFERARTTSGDTVAAIVSLVTEADPRLSVVVDAGVPSGSHPVSVWERDRDDAVKRLAASLGAMVYMDVDGVARLVPLPQLAGAPYWQVQRGQAKVSAPRARSRDGVFNALVVTGDPGGGVAPVFGVARDTNPSSRTRWGGPFGKRPRFYSSPLITTAAQAASTAAAMLPRYLTVAETIDLQALPHPGLEPWDRIDVEVSPGVMARHFVDGYTLPLGVGSGSVSIATRTTVGDDDGS